MWQIERFVGDESDALIQMLTWITENEDLVVEFQTTQVLESDGTCVWVVSYRARRPELQSFLS